MRRDSTCVLTCQVKNGLAPVELKFKWKKDGKPIEIEGLLDKKYEILKDGDTFKLKIKKFNKKDEGQYEIYLDEPSDFDISSSATVQLEPGLGNIKIYFIFIYSVYLYKYRY